MIQFEDAPSIDCSFINIIPFDTDPDLQAKLDTFVTVFLTHSARFFSKPLEKSVFYSRLSHEWHTEAVDIDPKKRILRATWIPDRIYFYTNRYELHWFLSSDVEIEPDPTIPPGFLEQDFIGEELPAVQGGMGELPDQLPSLLETIEAEAIPFSASHTSEEKAAREKERQRIRQARLRSALARLKAEQLAERYYKRYRTFEGLDDSDSELSEDEWGPPSGGGGSEEE
jgi:hypothetical protein